MSAFQNALDYIVSIQGIVVSIKDRDGTTFSDIRAVQSNYFRNSNMDEQTVSEGRQYVVSTKSISFVPSRGDLFIITPTDYYSIATVQEMRVLSVIIGYRLTIK